MVIAIEGWQDRADALQSKSTDLGESLAVVRSDIEGAEAEAALLTTQNDAAEVRAAELATEAATERARLDAFTNVSLAFEECAADRLQIVRGLWEHGSGFVASLEAPTAAECAAAQATLDGLVAAGG
jgi:hypothetical protein